MTTESPSTRRLPPAVADPAGRNGFLADVLEGLARQPKSIPPKYFYDEAGSRLFDEITHTDEYYVTRAELGIISRAAGDIAEICRLRRALVEFGSGSTRKARLILEAAPWIEVYAPCDISGGYLAGECRALERQQPGLAVVPVVADFTRPFALPAEVLHKGCVGMLLGSTIGNFDPDDARRLLRNFARTLGPESRLVIGVDLVKDRATLQRAYDDRAGVTARFNLNLLTRINRELGAEFDPARFAHRAHFNAGASRVEMHLVSRCHQIVRVGRQTFTFLAGETIHTENSYKYSIDGFAALLGEAGYRPLARWSDGRFALFAAAPA
jgi:dimethylhistidine N-methyltransferase